MPRYFCDYCQTYLTHDSAPGRKQHNRGWKHKENVKLYYDQYVAAFQAEKAQQPGGGPPGASMGCCCLGWCWVVGWWVWAGPGRAERVGKGGAGIVIISSSSPSSSQLQGPTSHNMYTYHTNPTRINIC